MITTSITPFYTPQSTTSTPNSRQSTSFGIKVTRHAKKRLTERNIDLNRAIETIRSGKKFIDFKNDEKHILNLGYRGEGKVPEGTMVAVTDETGDILITTNRAAPNQYEIIDGKLKKQFYHQPQGFKMLEPWERRFSKKIFETITFLSAASSKKHNKKSWQAQYLRGGFNS